MKKINKRVKPTETLGGVFRVVMAIMEYIKKELKYKNTPYPVVQGENVSL
jgi:hypothetical protein